MKREYTRMAARKNKLPLYKIGDEVWYMKDNRI